MKERTEKLAKAEAKSNFENPDSVWAQANFTNSLHFQGMSEADQREHQKAIEAEMLRLMSENRSNDRVKFWQELPITKVWVVDLVPSAARNFKGIVKKREEQNEKTNNNSSSFSAVSNRDGSQC